MLFKKFRSFVQRTAWGLFGASVLEAALMWASLSSWAFSLAACFALFVLFHSIATEFRGWIERPKATGPRVMYVVDGVILLGLIPVAIWLNALALETGKFGEPPHNRIVRVYPGAPGPIVEFGVKAVPMKVGFGTLVKFDKPQFSFKRCWFGQPGNPASRTLEVNQTWGGVQSDPLLYLLDPKEGAITATQSFYLQFLGDQGLQVVGCNLRNSDESMDKAPWCGDGIVFLKWTPRHPD